MFSVLFFFFFSFFSFVAFFVVSNKHNHAEHSERNSNDHRNHRLCLAGNSLICLFVCLCVNEMSILVALGATSKTSFSQFKTNCYAISIVAFYFPFCSVSFFVRVFVCFEFRLILCCFAFADSVECATLTSSVHLSLACSSKHMRQNRFSHDYLLLLLLFVVIFFLCFVNLRRNLNGSSLFFSLISIRKIIIKQFAVSCCWTVRKKQRSWSASRVYLYFRYVFVPLVSGMTFESWNVVFVVLSLA